MIFRFSEVTLKSEIVALSFFFVVDDKLAAADGKLFEGAGRVMNWVIACEIGTLFSAISCLASAARALAS